MKNPGKSLALTIAFFFLVCITNSQNTNFEKQWRQVDSLSESGLPKSALEIVNAIYQQSKKNSDNPQFIKAVIWKIKLTSAFLEDPLLNSIYDLKTEIPGADQPVKQILYSMLGELLQQYQQNNRWRFNDRSTLGGNQPDSINTWDLNTLNNEIKRNYLLSLQNPELLKNTPIGNYKEILTDQPSRPSYRDKSKSQEKKTSFRPTLFDFLAWRALDYFTGNNQPKNQPFASFRLDDPKYLLPAAEWVKMKVPDSAVPGSEAVRILHDVAAFHLNDSDPKALIDQEVKRLEYFHDLSTFENRDSLYIMALRRAEKLYLSSPWSTDISYALAAFLANQGNLYIPGTSDKYRWYLKDAAEVCRKAIELYPQSEGAVRCNDLLKTINVKTVDLTVEYSVVPEKEFPALVKFRNVEKLWFRIIKADPENVQETISGFSTKERIAYFNSFTPVKSWNINIPATSDYQSHSTELVVPEVPAGFYYIMVSTDEKFSDSLQAITWTPFFATRISYISQPGPANRVDFYILDRENGNALKNVTAEVLIRKFDYSSRKNVSQKIATLSSDESGFFYVTSPGESNNNFYLKLSTPKEFLITDNFFVYHEGRPQDSQIHTEFYTDRSIYRPGQTIYFKGIVTRQGKDLREIVPATNITVTLFDANSTKVTEQTFTTNDFGSFNGSFTAPRNVLTGRMSLSCSSGSAGFSVEEYKRPTFEVVIEPAKGNYRLNDSVSITGHAKAYAGNVISGGKVQFRVVRTARFPFRDNWWIPLPSTTETEIANGVATTSNDGSFSFNFFALPDLTIRDSNPVFDYSVTVDVMDLNGETRSANSSIAVGYQSLILTTGVPEKLNLAKDSVIKISTTNLNLQKTPASVNVVIERLRDPDRILKKRLWAVPDLQILTRQEFHSHFPYDPYGDEDRIEKYPVESVILDKSMNTSSDSVINIKELTNLKPGNYRITLKSTDPSGQPVTFVDHFAAFNPGSKEVPAHEAGWFVPLTKTVEPGGKARFLIGSAEEGINVLYEIHVHDTLFSRQWLRINDNQLMTEIPVREDFRGNFSVTFAFVKHNRSFIFTDQVIVPYSNKDLNIKIESFRNKIVPGSKEEWKITISDASKIAVDAEFLAAMYDASLDVFGINQWNLPVFWPVYGNNARIGGNSFKISSGAFYPTIFSTSSYNERYYPELNWFGIGFSGNRGGRYLKNTMVETKDESMPMTAGILYKDLTVVESAGSIPAVKPAPVPIKVRKDFRETAFFYPALHTDKDGSLVVKFNAPESLTGWKFMGLAHSKDLKAGLITKDLVTQKDLMVFPNVPRFIRQGDTLIFSTKIVNLADGALKGHITLELSDAVSGEPLKLILPEKTENNSTEFTITAGKSDVYSWKIAIPVDASLSLLQYKITALSGTFSDAEENVIPVLTNRMLVTESLPLPVRGPGTFNFDLKKLTGSKIDQSLKNYRLTLEFSSNPVWYAIQALPSLEEPRYPSADNIFTAFYANSIASYLANSNPRIQKIFESWKKITPDALLSNLEKNEDLKSVILQETPWVLDAKDESQRKLRVGQLFDINTLSGRLDQNLSTLRKMQKQSGGWPWFEGMEESLYVTQRIVTGLGHLHHLGIKDIRKDKETWDMITRAVSFIDDEILKEYNNLKKNYPSGLKENHLSGTAVQYLYCRSYFIKDIPLSNTGAYSYFKGQAAEYWLSQDIYLQGMIALALNRDGNAVKSQQILKSFSEKALHSPEMGMYWAQKPGFSWFDAPVETQALMIEAYDEVNNDLKSVNELKIWLLKQKQTNDWKTASATSEACYALLLKGDDLLSSDQKVKFFVGKKEIDPEKSPEINQEAGTGYFRISWTGKDIDPEMGKISVIKTGEGIAWGALYWQYFEDLDKITPAQTPLTLEKKVFIESNTPSGPVLNQAGNPAEIKTGDKMKVRIVVKADRSMEYVLLKDMRASSFEPVVASSLSGYRYSDGLGYYQTTTDAATLFFFDYLPKGTYVFEYPLLVNAAGNYSNGITTVQCLYAPEFGAHSEGIRVKVK